MINNNITIPSPSFFNNNEDTNAPVVTEKKLTTPIDNQHKLHEEQNKLTIENRNIQTSENTEEKILYIEKLIDIFSEIKVTKGKHKELAEKLADLVFQKKIMYKYKDRIGRNQQDKRNIFVRYRMENNMPIIFSWGFKVDLENAIHGFVLEDCTPRMKFL